MNDMIKCRPNIKEHTCGGGVGGGVAINDAYKLSCTPSCKGGGNGSVAGLATSIDN